MWRETSSNVTLGFGAAGEGTSDYAQTANLTATTPTQAVLYCGGFNASTASIALRKPDQSIDGALLGGQFFVARASALRWVSGRGAMRGA